MNSIIDHARDTEDYPIDEYKIWKDVFISGVPDSLEDSLDAARYIDAEYLKVLCRLNKAEIKWRGYGNRR